MLLGMLGQNRCPTEFPTHSCLARPQELQILPDAGSPVYISGLIPETSHVRLSQVDGNASMCPQCFLEGGVNGFDAVTKQISSKHDQELTCTQCSGCRLQSSVLGVNQRATARRLAPDLLPEISCGLDDNHLPTDIQMVFRETFGRTGVWRFPQSTCIKPSFMVLLEMES